MSHYADYVREREGLGVLENDDGFVTFSIMGSIITIHDMYVRPEARRARKASKMADELCAEAKRHGAVRLVAYVDTTTRNADDSEKALRGYGMRAWGVVGSRVMFVKEI